MATFVSEIGRFSQGNFEIERLRFHEVVEV